MYCKTNYEQLFTKSNIYTHTHTTQFVVKQQQQKTIKIKYIIKAK